MKRAVALAIESRLRDYVHVLCRVIEWHAMRIIDSPSSRAKIRHAIEMGRIAGAAEILQARLLESIRSDEHVGASRDVRLLAARATRTGRPELALLAVARDIRACFARGRGDPLFERDALILRNCYRSLGVAVSPSAHRASGARSASTSPFGGAATRSTRDGDYRAFLARHPEPARQPGLRRSASRIHVARTNEELVGSQDAFAAFLHHVFIDVEIAAMEVCSYSLLRFREMPIAFMLDMARQAWDEARHARAVGGMLRDAGVRVGGFPYTNVVIERYRLARDVREVLAVQQLVQEANAVEVTPHLAAALRARGREELAAAFDRINVDESLHVRIGNRWLRFVLRDDRRRYLTVLRRAARRIDLPVFGKGAWNADLRRRCGFPEEFVRAGSRFARTR